MLGEGTLGVAELAEDHVVGLINSVDGEVCDVVGVVTPLVFAEVRRLCCMVIRLSSSVCCSGLCMRKERSVEEDWEDQVEVEREEGEVKEKRTRMTMRMK